MEHAPVLCSEALQQLVIKQDGIYLDCTFGRGGHSQRILEQLGLDGRLLAIDRDAEAVGSEKAQILLKDKRFTMRHKNFSEVEGLAIDAGISGKVDGILIDLGVSSPQLDNPLRGFSFLRDGPLDMRMDSGVGISAAQWLAAVDENRLVKVLFEYGEERYARRIANAIVEARAVKPICSTQQLADLVSQAIPIKDKYKHPATRTFQAIRIEINHELQELQACLRQSVQLLKPQGRLVVISFHSLEDRIVKRFIKNEAGAKYNPGKLPIKEADIRKGIIRQVGKAIKPSQQEMLQNPRARSAIMRVAERV
jgi:16S rRNA (cytosine1402-N4)-methyltransferase